MWKDSYRIGVEVIDQQHRELFRMVENLFREIEHTAEWEDRRDDCIAVIGFLKSYVVMHFNYEESYQEQMRYEGIEEHKKAHRAFTETVLDYERRFMESNFDRDLVRGFAGMLVSWLIYHVADADQRIVGGRRAVQTGTDANHAESLLGSAREVLETMVGITPEQTRAEPAGENGAHSDIVVTIGVNGAVEGRLVYGFSRELAFELLRGMTMMEVNEVDELVCSAVAEICNIISGNVLTRLASEGTTCDITPPIVERKSGGAVPGDGMTLHAPNGAMDLAFVF